jgi:hypothetical protein
MLECAEALLKANKTRDAQALYQALAEAPQPAFVQRAAQSGLKRCSS